MSRQQRKRKKAMKKLTAVQSFDEGGEVHIHSPVTGRRILTPSPTVNIKDMIIDEFLDAGLSRQDAY